MIILVYYPDMSSHLALGLTGLGREKNIYISFFPGNERSIAGFRLHELDHDRYSNTTIPGRPVQRVATIINLPSEESCGYGLSEQAIYDWWKQLKPVQEDFSWFTNNCSSIIYRALHQGQLGARSLGNKPLIAKSWFCTPGNVMSYALKVAGKIREQAILGENLIFQYVELANLCELGQLQHSYSQFQALYIRIKQFANNQNYNAILNQKFCDAIQEVIYDFHNEFATESLFKKIEESDDESSHDDDSSDNADIESPNVYPEQVSATIRQPIDDDYVQLNAIYVNLLRKRDASQIQKLEALIAKKILAPMAIYITQFIPRIEQDKISIERTLQEVANVIDANNNPKKAYVQKGDAIPLEYRQLSRF